MKTLLIFLVSLIITFTVKGQTWQANGSGNGLTEIYQNGAYGSALGFHFRNSFSDTGQANAYQGGVLKNLAGFVIRCVDDQWMRSNDLQKWNKINSSGSTGVSSVGLTVTTPASPAFSVSNSPITSSGNIALNLLGTTSQYIRGDGSLATYNNPTTVAWSLTGNAGTTSGTNFVGTTDAVDFIISANSTPQLTFRQSGQWLLPKNTTISGANTKSLIIDSMTNFTIRKNSQDRVIVSNTLTRLFSNSGDCSITLNGDLMDINSNSDIDVFSLDSIRIFGGTANSSLLTPHSDLLLFGNVAYLNPSLGNLIIDTLNNVSTQDRLVGWVNASGSDRGKVGYITVGTGLSLSSGNLTSTVTGTVTFIATTSPITGGTITSTGTIACATCVTSASSLTANSLMIGSGSQASAVTTTGTGVLTALGVNTGSAGAFVVNGGALGTPSSGTVTNLTGTASININGTVGATTPTTGVFTTGTFSSTTALSTGSAAVTTVGGGATVADFRLLEGSAGGTNYVGFKANATLAGNTIYTLPTAFPAGNNYLLNSSTAGVMGFTDPATFATAAALSGYVAKTGSTTLSSPTWDMDGNSLDINNGNFSVTAGAANISLNGTVTSQLGDIGNGVYFKVSGSGGSSKVFALSTAIAAGTDGDAITLIDHTTGELGTAPNLAFQLHKGNTDLYVKDGRIMVKDKDNNITQISPHNDKGEWIYKSTDKNGVTTEINMIRLAELLEKVTGEKLIFKSTGK